MAYRAQRSQSVIEDFELVDEHGRTVETIHVDINGGKMLELLSRKYLELVNLQRELVNELAGPRTKMAAYEKIGECIIDMIEIVFGTENGEKVIKFFGSNYTELTYQVMPFITDIVIPKLRAKVKDQRKEVKTKYNRKQRRALFRRI